MTSAERSAGLVVAAHGRRGILEAGAQRFPYMTRGRGLRVVCGDRVRFEQPAGSAELLVVALLPRTNALSRVAVRPGEDEVVAANLTQLVAVCAPRPEPDLFLLDRYFAAAELMGCRPVLCWNKSDLGGPSTAALRDYSQLDYPLLTVSARSGESLVALREALAGNTSVLVGQSGVGKSSLINALTPGAQATIGELSGARLTGTHTTTASLMYDLDSGGRLIDTPGVRDFVPAFGDARIDRGFPELRRLADGCRFADCSHLHEPGCAVKEALAAGTIPARRYASYQRLVQTMQDRASPDRG